MKSMPEEFVIFDTEYTAWEGSMENAWSKDGEYKEIVQIGAIKVQNLIEVASYQVFIKPVKNPVVSDYFTNLTGISQATIDEQGISLTDALQQFSLFTNGLIMYSFGRDCDVIKENTDVIHVAFPFDMDQCRDVREVFTAAGVDVKRYSSGTIPNAFNVKPPPHAHDALNDARSILVALGAAAKNK